VRDIKILAYDTSMSSPGVALLELKNNKPVIVGLSHVKTTSKDTHALRHEIIYAWSLMFIDRFIRKGIDVIVREDFQGRSSMQNHPVFSAWSAVDSSLHQYGLSFNVKPISQSAVKKAVVGVGKAEKHEVETAVRKWTGYTGEFAKDDESDACAIGLAYLIREGLIKP
jgi:crossover junction endodeoxyribonuclease RuvC